MTSEEPCDRAWMLSSVDQQPAWGLPEAQTVGYIRARCNVEFRMQEQRWPLFPGDMLFVPANAAYSYHNLGRTTASFISIIGGLGDWPPKASYVD